MPTINYDRRGAPRNEIMSSAVVHLLGNTAKTNSQPFKATIVDISSKGLRLQSATRLNTGAIVRVEASGTMVLGEVCYCVPEPNDYFSMGIAADHSLSRRD